jgi:hypothetical protein
MDLNFQIQYKKGIRNVPVDAFSGCPQSDSAKVSALSEFIPSLVQNIQASHEVDFEANELITELGVSQANTKGYTP